MAEDLDILAGIDEDQALLADIEFREQCGDLVEAVQPVHPDLRSIRSGSGGDAGAGENHARSDHGPGAGGCGPCATLQPLQQILRIADGGGHPYPLDVAPDRVLQAGEHGGEVPAAVVAGEGVDLVDDDGLHVAEEVPVIDAGGDHH